MWPKQTFNEMNMFFGQIGDNLTTIEVPKNYPMKFYMGPTKVNKITVNKKIIEPVSKVLNKVLEHYGPEKLNNSGMDLFYGCYNPRRMRGGSAWSVHAWAAALDFDAAYNALKWNSSKARLAQPFYDKWWELWENEGAVSLGRTKNYDWMHIQFARL